MFSDRHAEHLATRSSGICPDTERDVSATFHTLSRLVDGRPNATLWTERFTRTVQSLRRTVCQSSARKGSMTLHMFPGYVGMIRFMKMIKTLMDIRALMKRW